jgi:hypothetical protein
MKPSLAQLLAESARNADSKRSHYKTNCTNCNAALEFSEDDLELWRTDDVTGDTGNNDDQNERDVDDDDDDDSDQDDDDDSDDLEQYAKDPRAVLARAIARAASKSGKTVSGKSEVSSSKVAELKAKYAGKDLSVVDRILINRGKDPVDSD